MNLPTPYMSRRTSFFARLLVFILLGAGPTVARAASPPGIVDNRVVYSDAAPDWLAAVGKLRVPGSRYREGRRSHLQEDCSATLVSRGRGKKADTIVTAWHCLAFYNDLSKPITFTLLPGRDQSVVREAYRLADGGGMHADWAVLRLYQPIVTELALAIHPGRADPARPVSMAGYSRDTAKGDGGKALTFDPSCFITQQAARVSDSNCTAYRGASGGAVVQLSPRGKAQLTGVISQGDSAGLSLFVPVAIFRSAILK